MFKVVEEERKGPKRVLICEGRLEIGHSCEVLKTKVMSLVAQGDVQIALDLRGLTYVDSSGLGDFVTLLKELRNRGGDLEIVNPNQQVRRLFAITKLDQVFVILNG